MITLERIHKTYNKTFTAVHYLIKSKFVCKFPQLDCAT